MVMRFLRRLVNVVPLVALGGLALMVGFPMVAAAQPQPPMLLDGFVYINGVRAEEGVLVEARIEGEMVASEETAMFQGRSGYYVLKFFGAEGDPVALFVDGEEANESPVEYEMGATTLNLTVGGEELATYTLTIDAAGEGETDPTAGESDHAEGSVVTIRAFAAEGWTFDRWVGDVSNPGSPVTVVIMDSDKSVTANFVEPTPTPTATPTETAEPTLEPTLVPTATATLEPTATASPEPSPTFTPTAEATVEGTVAASPTVTPTATESQEEPTATQGATSVPAPPMSTATSAATSASEVTASATPRPEATASEGVEPTATGEIGDGDEEASGGLSPLIIVSIVLGVVGAGALVYGVYSLKPWRAGS
jgi:hypothetical protein